MSKPQQGPLVITDLRPSDTPEYMTDSWLDCIMWAATVPHFLDIFRSESGFVWSPASSPLDRMIDEASGMDRALCEAFIRWVNVNVWGPMEAPMDEDTAS